MKRVVGCLLALVMVVGLASPSFARVDKIGTLQKMGIVVGRGGGDLQLDALLTRGEFMKLLVYGAGIEKLAEGMDREGVSFTDVPASHWAYNYIALMKKYGVAKGFPDGRFRPDAPISYQEVIAFLVRLDRDFAEGKAVFGEGWAKGSIDYAKRIGLLEGIAVADFSKASTRRTAFELIYNGMSIGKDRKGIRDRIIGQKKEEKGAEKRYLWIVSPKEPEKPTLPSEDMYVTIPDPLFLKVINKNLDPNRPDDQRVTKKEMESLTMISHWIDDQGKPGIQEDAKKSILGTPKSLQGTEDFKFMVSYGIRSMEGIQYAKNLTHLKLNENEIRDLTPLKDLKKLEYLEFSRNRVEDVSPLRGLTNLTFLKLYNNQIEDVTPLANLVNLRGLDLHNNVRQRMIDGKRVNSRGVADISALKDLKKLTFFDVSANNLRDVSVIKNFNDVQDIDLSGNHIETYTGLEDFIAKRYVAAEQGIGSQNFWSQSVEMPEAVSVRGSDVAFQNPYKGFKELFVGILKEVARGEGEELSDDDALAGASSAMLLQSSTEGVDASYDMATNEIHLRLSDEFLSANRGKTADVHLTFLFGGAYDWHVYGKLKVDASI